MVHQDLIRRGGATVAAVCTTAVTAIALAGCASSPPQVQAATIAPRPSEAALPYPEAESAWGPIHSLRFHVRVPLPDPAQWTVDDASHAELVATHAPTRSRLVLLLETEPQLMNRQRCEARARELGLVPTTTLRTVEDAVTIGPEAYDTRVWVAIEAPKSEGEHVVGHVYAFGAYVKKCLVVHLSTEVPSARDEEVLSQRLALARVRTVGGLTIDSIEEIPREKAR